jgi:hypothetical protein
VKFRLLGKIGQMAIMRVLKEVRLLGKKAIVGVCKMSGYWGIVGKWLS